MKSLRFATGMACVLALLFSTSLALAVGGRVLRRGRQKA